MSETPSVLSIMHSRAGLRTGLSSLPRVYCGIPVIFACLAVAIVPAAGQGKEGEPAKAIRANAEAYVEAFNRGDAKALAAFWSEQGSWSNPLTGGKMSGRENIAEGFAALFKEGKGTRLALEVRSVEQLNADTAVEEGTATVTPPDGVPSKSDYTAIYVRTEGKWLVSRVIETTAIAEAAGPVGQLAEIGWLAGSWIDEGEASAVRFENTWIAGGRFLRREFAVQIGEKIDLRGIEIVGWDAAAKTIRSWVFDSEGTFAELRWKRGTDNPKRWVKEARGVLASGVTVTATHIMTCLDDDRYTFKAVSRDHDGELLPNIEEVTVVRVPSAP